MTIEDRHHAAQSRLKELLAEAQQRLKLERGNQDLGDFVTRQRLARDVETCASDMLRDLMVTESSLADAEEVIELCEQTLAVTPQSIQASLRVSAKTAII